MEKHLNKSFLERIHLQHCGIYSKTQTNIISTKIVMVTFAKKIKPTSQC